MSQLVFREYVSMSISDQRLTLSAQRPNDRDTFQQCVDASALNAGCNMNVLAFLSIAFVLLSPVFHWTFCEMELKVEQ